MRLAAGILIVGGVLFWRFEASLTAKSQSNGSPQQAIPVTADTAQTRDVPVYVEGLGTVQAFNMVTVKTRVDGQITKVLFKEGQEVKAGDPLFQIDPRPYHDALDLAQASKGKDEAALANAKLDLARYEKLVATNAINEQQVDTPSDNRKRAAQFGLCSDPLPDRRTDRSALRRCRKLCAGGTIFQPRDHHAN